MRSEIPSELHEEIMIWLRDCMDHMIRVLSRDAKAKWRPSLENFTYEAVWLEINFNFNFNFSLNLFFMVFLDYNIYLKKFYTIQKQYIFLHNR